MRFRLCVAGAPIPRNTFLQLSVKDGARGTRVGAQIPLSGGAVASCPTMKDVTLPLAGGTLDRHPGHVLVFDDRDLGDRVVVRVADRDQPRRGHGVGQRGGALRLRPQHGAAEASRHAERRGHASRVGARSQPHGFSGRRARQAPAVDRDRLNFAIVRDLAGSSAGLQRAGTRVTYRVCAVSAPQASALFVQHFLTDSRNKSAADADGSMTRLGLSGHCRNLAFAVADHASNDNSASTSPGVNLIGFEIGTQSTTQDPSVFFVDAIKVTRTSPVRSTSRSTPSP